MTVTTGSPPGPPCRRPPSAGPAGACGRGSGTGRGLGGARLMSRQRDLTGWIRVCGVVVHTLQDSECDRTCDEADDHQAATDLGSGRVVVQAVHLIAQLLGGGAQ